ncbi:phosphoserine phosphatase and phosphoglycerate dehydrogenase (D-3-phosphoglycerate dehydrogenase) fusion [Kordia algicida OT-1]|uniref:D-3-phosphoglycerate dehydrogenase n=1 Tax=Kordia algicida OT-1 TaxID=391587 RepID=A9DLI9_9FLAO|nr:phosphoglycerate dehydrogenase [Kordia algicida]EDP98576.1 phosphoserine phosphatase and phosphoglycerate dehydrogenase (D-3-phosphoglycerate dehydrogenase) fusion [Kordia algicida OT-1]
METAQKNYIFDFDSTLTSVEALDVLAEITLANNPKKEEIINEIQEITNLGVDGEISFTESLEKRIKLLNAHQSNLEELIEKLRQQLSSSIESNKEFFEKFSDDIYVVSCGFKEFIDPIVKDYNIPSNRVYANTFLFDEDGYIIGFDEENPLSQHNGKIQCLKDMNLDGEIQVIGDGYSDYVTRKAGVADKFFAFTENVEREKAVKKADHVTPNLDEFLFVNDLPRNISYPKNRIKILLLENIHSDAFDRLADDGFSVEILSHSLSEDDLIEKIKDIHVLGIRSKTQVTPKVIKAAKKLLTIGAFCIGTKQIDLETCKEHGIVVFNAPYSNTRSVVELAIGEIIMLMRSVFPRSTEIHNGQWQKTAKGSREVRGKKLGIVGYGNIGKQLSVLAEAMGMNVYYYDIEDRLALGNAQKCSSLEELLSISDVVSLHVDDNAANRNFFGKAQFDQMKDGALLINLARGFVVDIDALKVALESKKVAGAAIDVYPQEPRANGAFETPLQGLNNVILTPHVGGSTEEAQRDIADFVPNKIMAYVNSGNTVDAVNFPNIRLPRQTNAHRFLHIHKNVPGIMAKVNKVLAKYELNVTGQYLSTDSKVGYVIVDVDKEYNKKVTSALKKIENTIKFRILY